MRPASNCLSLELINIKLVKVFFDVLYKPENILRSAFFFVLLSANLCPNLHVLFRLCGLQLELLDTLNLIDDWWVEANQIVGLIELLKQTIVLTGGLIDLREVVGAQRSYVVTQEKSFLV